MTRRTREEWLDLFQSQVESGLSATEFCRRRGINSNYFFQRKAIIGADPGPANEKVAGFVELRPPAGCAGAVEVRFGKVSLSLPANASPSWVATLVRELSGATV